MHTRDLKAQIDGHLQAIADELAQGSGSGLLAHLKSHARFRTYSPMNRLAILLQRPHTRAVLGERAWQDLGRSLTQNARPIYILAPTFSTQDQAEPNDPDDPRHALPGSPTGRREQDAAPKRRTDTPVYYRTVRVYAAEDTDGPPMTLDDILPPREVSEEGLQRLLDECPYTVQWDDGQGVRTTGGVIRLPRGEWPQATEMMNLLYGWALLDLHDANPKLTHGEDTFQTEAALGAYAVAEVLGLPNQTFTLERIRLLWGGKPRRVKNGLARVDRSVQRLLNVLAPLAGTLTEEAAA